MIYPSPFSNTLNIDFELPRSEKVSIQLFDVDGKLIQILLSEKLLEKGLHRFIFNKKWVGTGVYFIKLKTAETVTLRKIIGM